MTNRKVFLCFVGADSTHNRYGIISPIFVDKNTQSAPDTGKFEFLPILDGQEYDNSPVTNVIPHYSNLSYILKEISLRDLIKSALMQRYKIEANYWNNILNILSSRTGYTHATILYYLTKCGLLGEYDRNEILDVIGSKDLVALVDKMTERVLESSAHNDPVIDEKRNILSYGDHPDNYHGEAFIDLGKDDVILFVSRLVPYDRNQGTFVVRGSVGGNPVKVATELENLINKYTSKGVAVCCNKNKRCESLYRELMYIPYVYDYYFVGYLVVEEIVKIDEIVKMYKKDIRKARQDLVNQAAADRRILENPHFSRFMYSGEDMWIILGKEGSRLFDEAVIVSDMLLNDLVHPQNSLNKDKRLIIYKDERYDECDKKEGMERKTCYLRGSSRLTEDGAKKVIEYLKSHGVDLDL